jgi:hypothetical protein
MKKWLGLMSASLLLAAMLAGCAGEPAEGSSSDASSAETTVKTTAATTKATEAETTTASTAAETTAPPKSAFKSDLTFVNSIGAWLETADGYQILADDTKAFWSLSDTEMKAGQAFTYEMDVTVNDPLKNAQVVLYFGVPSDEHVKHGAYEVRYGFKDNLMRIFYTGPETRRYGQVVTFTDEQMGKTSFHLKMEMGADKQATYYLNDEKIATVDVPEYEGGYLGIGTYGTNAVFQNIAVAKK